MTQRTRENALSKASLLADQLRDIAERLQDERDFDFDQQHLAQQISEHATRIVMNIAAVRARNNSDAA